jgi:hypothetical protein
MVFWESSLLRTGRESLADNGAAVAAQNAVTVTNNTHPITQGLTLGTMAMFTSNQTHNIAMGNISPNAAVLATRFNTPAQPAILIAEAGSTLLGNYLAPARRVFLFFDDTSYNAANAAARQVLDNSVCWAMGLNPTIITPPAPVQVAPGGTAMFSVVAAGATPRTYQWRRAGVPVANSARISGATTPALTITNAQAADAGTYDVVVSTTICGGTTSAGAVLTVALPCAADFNNSGAATVQDIFDFLAAYFAGGAGSDFNHSGSVTVQDIFDFLAAYFSGC